MPSPAEQLFIELVNRARLDPLGEAGRFGIDLNEGLDPGTLDGSFSRQPLAANALLEDAARAHSQWMLEENIFSHTGDGGSSSTDRIEAAGYVLEPPWSTGENLAWTAYGDYIDAPETPDDAIPAHHRGLFESPGHRLNILNDAFRETGAAQETGIFTAKGSDGTLRDYTASMMTGKFAVSGEDVFLTGVAYADDDGDGFYSIGEGIADVTVTAGAVDTVTAAAGGYALALAAQPDLEVVLTPSGGALLRARLDLSQGNVKLDLVDGTRLLSSADLTLLDGVAEAGLLGAADLALTGNDLDNLLFVNRGDNEIAGGAGADTVVFTGARADYDITVEGTAVIVADTRESTESDGTNTLTGVQILRFADGEHAVEIDPWLRDALEPGDGPLALSGSVQAPDGAPVGDAWVHFTPQGAGQPAHGMRSLADGGFALGLEDDAAGRLDAVRDFQAGDPAITPGDALDVLRLAVGLAPSWGPATAENFIAADIDRSGAVTAQDALEVLRAAVGLEAENAPRWVFVDGEDDLTGVTGADTVDYDTGIDIAALDSDLDVALTGILLGNMESV